MRKKEYDKRLLYVFKIIGKNITKGRGGMSKTELSEKSGVSRSTIIKIEDGLQNISIKKLINIADALEINPAELLMEDKENDTQITLKELIKTLIKKELGEIIIKE